MLRKKIVLQSFLVLFLGAAALAQLPTSFEVHVGGGFTVPTGDLSGRLDGRGHFLVGAGYNFLPKLELQAEYMHNTFGISRSELARNNEPNGDANVNSLTIDPVLHIHLPFTRLGAHAMAGIGYYRRTVEFTRPTTALTTFFDPFFGFFTAAVPANQIIGSVSRDGFGYNIGAGLDYNLSGPAQLYFEVRYHDAHMAHGNTQMVPLTIGLRF